MEMVRHWNINILEQVLVVSGEPSKPDKLKVFI